MRKKKEKKELLSDRDEQKKLWRAELENMPFFKDAVKEYNEHSVASWLDNYTGKKYEWLNLKDMNEENYEYQQMRWLDEAGQHLEIIQQKKLFDLQCEWRAERIQIPGVEICFDFTMWEHDILNCPFIEPVSEQDIALYLRYLEYPGAEPLYRNATEMLQAWQDYDDMKEEHTNNDDDWNGYDLPAWYAYHNQFAGTGNLLLLPDIRGEKERHYCDPVFTARNEKADAAAAAAGAPRDSRPLLFLSDDDFFNQVLAHEDSEVRKARELYEWRSRCANEASDILEMTEELLQSEQPIAIDAHSNWYDALRAAYRTYQCQQLAEALPAAFEQYQMNIQMGIGFPASEKDTDFYQSLRTTWMENILEGRRMMGEEESLDF